MIKVTKYNENYRNILFDGVKYLSDEERTKLNNAIEHTGEDEEFLICVDDENNFVGFAKTTCKKVGFVVLDYIYVAPRLRRDKNGSVILVAVTTRAVNNLNAAIFCQCDKDNKIGLAFLKARNFIIAREEEGIFYLVRNLAPMYKVNENNN